MNTAVFGLYWLKVNYFALCWWLVTMCDISLVVGVINMMNTTCGTGLYWPSWAFCVQLQFYCSSCCSNLSFLMRTIVSHLFSLSLTFVLRYVGVFRFSLCLLGLKLSLYLVRILYFVVMWIIIRLHQSNQAHSKTCQDLLNCEYQIPSML